MDNPERHLREFIRNYYYGQVSEETVEKDVAALTDFMKERGWQFDSIPSR